jgi:serine protease AprX
MIAAVAALVGLSVSSMTPAAGASASAEATRPADSTVTLSMWVEPGKPVPLELVRAKAERFYDGRGATGQGIDVAVIDSGVTPVAGLDMPGKVVYGPDLSNEGGQPNLANLDTYGHGTHLAGIIAGDDGDEVIGVARDSRIVSLKVAGATGETDVAQVVAAVDWVVEHKDTDGMNIRVLNLSLGLPGVPSNQGDPLSAAVERAWDAGIVVVAAAGNRGNAAGGLDSPAVSPYVLAVGAIERFRSFGVGDRVPSWTSGGDGVRNPDVLAPGRSIQSFRVAGSTLDQMHPTARVGDRYFTGSGTSQAAAVVSGYAAALLSMKPSLTPDQVKFLFTEYARDMVPGTTIDGSGKLNARLAARFVNSAWRAPVQEYPHAWDGAGPDGTTVEPTGASWSGGAWHGASWSGGAWHGASWSSASWSGASWSGASWSGASWSGASWASASWSSASWSGASWAGVSWSGEVWE